MHEDSVKKYWLPLLALGLLVVVVFLVYFDWQNSHKRFTFAMLDIGQGDALFIESPTGTQVLVDGGPPKKILSELPKVMFPLDHSIDAIFITNPDQDHIGGFLDVLKNYKVGEVFVSGTTSDSKTYQNLEEEIKKEKIPQILVKRGMNIDLGGGAEINIIFPDRDVSTWPTNDGSIVARLTYGKNSIMLTGDASIKTEQIILEDNPKGSLQSDILKVAHHGSRNSSSEEFVQAVDPKTALISDGKNNKYGHPHQEVLDLLNKFGIKILRTDQIGTIIIKCDNMEICKINK